MTRKIRNRSTYNHCMSCVSSRRLHSSSQSSSEHCSSIIGFQKWTVKGATNAVSQIWNTIHSREFQL